MNERGDWEDKNREAPLTERAKQLFDESVARLDADALSRLNRSRQRAIAEANRRGPGIQWLRLAPVAAVVSAAAVAVIVWTTGNGVRELPPETASDFEVLLAEEDFEMLEDLEFYRWMALEETAIEPATDDHVG